MQNTQRYRLEIVNPDTGYSWRATSSSPKGAYISWKNFWFKYSPIPPYLFGFIIDTYTDKTLYRLENGMLHKIRERE